MGRSSTAAVHFQQTGGGRFARSFLGLLRDHHTVAEDALTAQPEVGRSRILVAVQRWYTWGSIVKLIASEEPNGSDIFKAA